MIFEIIISIVFAIPIASMLMAIWVINRQRINQRNIWKERAKIEEELDNRWH